MFKNGGKLTELVRKCRTPGPFSAPCGAWVQRATVAKLSASNVSTTSSGKQEGRQNVPNRTSKRNIARKTSFIKSPAASAPQTVDYAWELNSQPQVTAGSESDERLQPSTADQWDIDFTDTDNAYRSKSTNELIRAALVFKLCTIDKLVDYNLQLASLGQKILGQSTFKFLMKKTFYGQFVAGENELDIKPQIDKMQKYGVGAILDYAVEEDISEEKAKDLEMSSCISDVGLTQTETSMTKFRPHREFGDRRRKVVSARTYFYTDEAKCDDNMKIFLKCIDAAGSAASDGFAAIKLTALGRPQFLLQFSEALIRAWDLFHKLSVKNVDVLKKGFDRDRFQKKAKSLGILMSRDDSDRWFTWMDVDESGFVDLLDWNSLVSNNRKFSEIFVVPNPQTGEMESLLTDISDEEDAQMHRMLQRMDILARRADSKGVRLMVDAEQTYFQPAITRITVEMMRRFNKQRPVILNTYQCYLKEAYNNLCVDLALAQKEGFHFGCKLVRGAYMEQERERALKLSYEDPIQPTYDDTTKSYLKTLDHVLDHTHRHGNINVMVASHNEETVKFALKRMHDLKITPESKQVFFGQLLGMCDHVTFPLGQAGHSVFKYVPFGPVKEVMPYLSRRAQENRGMLVGAQRERQMLWSEIRRRTCGNSTAA